MQVLAIIHVEGEGLGRLEPVLAGAGARISKVRMYRRDPLPLFPHGYDAVISMGGPMNVYDRQFEWFFAQESLLLRRATELDLPVLGICLGSQLIARALGAKVVKAPAREIGFFRVELTAAGRRDGLFRGVPASFPVVQWHEDTFELPEGAELLVTGADVPHQGYRFRNAYGLQFHLEADLTMLTDWVDGKKDLTRLLDQYPDHDRELLTMVRTVGENLVTMVRARGHGVENEDKKNEYAV